MEVPPWETGAFNLILQNEPPPGKEGASLASGGWGLWAFEARMVWTLAWFLCCGPAGMVRSHGVLVCASGLGFMLSMKHSKSGSARVVHESIVPGVGLTSLSCSRKLNFNCAICSLENNLYPLTSWTGESSMVLSSPAGLMQPRTTCPVPSSAITLHS